MDGEGDRPDSFSDNKPRSEILREQPGNDACADCGCRTSNGRTEPSWVSRSLGVLICKDCANIHKEVLPTRIVEKITSINQWTEEQFEEFSRRSNEEVNREYEAMVPRSYRRPQSFDPLVMRKQWVLGKYDREDFRSSSNSYKSYQMDNKQGYLWKRGKNKDTFKRRLFILDEKEYTLRYYTKELAKEPKHTFRLQGLNVVVLPDDRLGSNRPNSMQIIWDTVSKTRCLFVYADMEQELVEWYSCVRWVKLKRLSEDYQRLAPHEVCTMLTHDFVKEGWLRKTGPRPSDAYRDRWFTLDIDKLLYSKGPLEAFPRRIPLGGSEDGYKVDIGVPSGYRQPSHSLGFTLVTPKRNFCLAAKSEHERREWMTWLEEVIKRQSTGRNTCCVIGDS